MCGVTEADGGYPGGDERPAWARVDRRSRERWCRRKGPSIKVPLRKGTIVKVNE